MTYSPKENVKYLFTNTNEYYEMDIDLELEFNKEGDNVIVNSIIEDVHMNDKTDGKFASNSSLQNYVGENRKIILSNKGKILRGSESSTVFINGLLFMEFPINKLKVGDAWYGTKSAKPDIFFTTLKTEYECVEIKESEIKIAVTIISMDDNSNGLNTSRIYKGNYIVNRDGTVKSAELKISGSSMVSDISGEVIIKQK